MTTKIANGFGQFDYSKATLEEDLIEGQLHSRGDGIRAFNPHAAQSSTVTYSGADGVTGEYKIKIRHKVTGREIEFAFTNTGETLQETVDELVAASAGVYLFNLVEVSNNALVVTLAFQDPDGEFEVTPTQPGGITAVVATTNAGGTVIPFGRFLVLDSSIEDGVALPNSGSVSGDIRCVSGRSLSQINQGSTDIDDVDAYQPGSLIANSADGLVAMKNVGSVDAARGGVVHCVKDTAGGQELGQARSDADGGNTVVLDSRHCHWATPTAVGAVGWVKTNLA